MVYRRPDFNPDSLPLRFGVDSSVIEGKDADTDARWKYNEDKSRNEECDFDTSSNKENEDGSDSARTDTQSITNNDSNDNRMKLNKSIQDAKDQNEGEEKSREEEGGAEVEEGWNELLNLVKEDVHDEDGEGEEGGESSSDSATTISAHKKNRKKGMTHSFNNSIYSTSSSPSDYTPDADVGLAIFGNTVLRDMGYTETSRWVPSDYSTVYNAEESEEDNENNKEENKGREKEVENDKDGCVWEVTIIASASYVVHVSLSADLRVIKAAERKLAWVNSTLLAGTDRDRDRDREKNSAPGGLTKSHVPQDLLESDPLDMKKDILRTHDIRTRLTSEKKLYPGDALYDAVCPDGRAPIEIDSTTQLPTSSEFLLEGYRVIFARKLHDRTFYEFMDTERSDDEYKLQCTIRVSRSTHYEGEDGNLNNEMLISDINLKINIDPLIAFHQFPEDHSTPNAQVKINRFLSRAINHSLLLSDRIEAAHNTV